MAIVSFWIAYPKLWMAGVSFHEWHPKLRMAIMSFHIRYPNVLPFNLNLGGTTYAIRFADMLF